MPAPASELTASLERAVVRALVGEWRRINDSYFKNGLALPSIELVETTQHLGRWVPDTRIIEMSRRMVVEKPWGAVVEVLKHEMAHQYAHEILSATDETSHGPAFRGVCERLGIDAAASGLPRTREQGEANDEVARAVERVARLLALAGSPNAHEAEAAMAAAQRVMLKYNIEHASAHAKDYGFRHLGKPTGRVGEAERILASILGKHFFVDVIWVPVYRPLEQKRGSVLEICGRETNLAIAEYVHGFLLATAERLWDEHKAAEGVRSNRDRRVFLSGVMTGFADKLAREAKKSQAAGLVWVGDGDLARFFKKRHPYVRHVRYGGMRKNETFDRGRAEGRKIVLHRGVAAGAVNRGRLLGS